MQMLLILVIPVSRKRKEKFYRHLLSDCILMLRLWASHLYIFTTFRIAHFSFIFIITSTVSICVFESRTTSPWFSPQKQKNKTKKTEYFPSVSESRCRICSAASLAHFTLHPQSRTVNIVEINPTERITTKKYRKVGNKYSYFYSI